MYTPQKYGFTSFVDCSKESEYFDEVQSKDMPFPDIEKRTLIESRSIVKPQYSMDQLVDLAIKRFYEAQGISDRDAHAVVVSTSNSHQLSDTLSKFASRVAVTHGMPASHGLNYACSGFPAAVDAAMQLPNPRDKQIIIVFAEMLSRMVNIQDKNTAILFGDGLVVTSIEPEGKHPIHSSWAHEIEDPKHCLSLDEQGNIVMGSAEGKHLYRTVPQSLVDLVAHTREGIAGVTRIVPHQANGKFIGKMKSILRKQAPQSDVEIVLGIEDAANTASASIPRALAKHMDRFESGDVIACPAKGAGKDYKKGKLTEGVTVFSVGQ